jgi:hypothetical protein
LFGGSEAVQVIVSLLADESPVVREASSASLKDIAAFYLSLSLSLSLCNYVFGRVIWLNFSIVGIHF